MTKEEIAKIKANIEYWGNNCGGCEACSQAFGDKELTYDMQTVYELIQIIEEQEAKIKELHEKVSSR